MSVTLLPCFDTDMYLMLKSAISHFSFQGLVLIFI